MSSLLLLKDYDSSDEDDDKNVSKTRLPPPILPDSLVPLRSIARNPTKSVNDGKRIRSFAHEAGNWATFVAVPVKLTPELDAFLDLLVEELSPLPLERVDDFHISLTRVLVLRHHWIAGFVDGIRQVFSKSQRSPLFLQGLSVFTNDDKTRTFIALDVRLGDIHLNLMVDNLDASLSEYGLPKFYENRLFHTSLLWILGDQSALLKERLQFLSEQTKAFSLSFNFEQCICKTGNKVFNFKLGNS